MDTLKVYPMAWYIATVGDSQRTTSTMIHGAETALLNLAVDSGLGWVVVICVAGLA